MKKKFKLIKKYPGGPEPGCTYEAYSDGRVNILGKHILPEEWPNHFEEIIKSIKLRIPGLTLEPEKECFWKGNLIKIDRIEKASFGQWKIYFKYLEGEFKDKCIATMSVEDFSPVNMKYVEEPKFSWKQIERALTEGSIVTISQERFVQKVKDLLMFHKQQDDSKC